MIIGLIRNNNFITSWLVLIALWAANFIYSISEVEVCDVQFVIALSVTQLCWVGTIVLLRTYNAKHKFIGLGDYLPSFVFLLFVSAIQHPYLYWRFWVALFLLVLTVARIMALYNSKKDYIKVFEVGVLLGLVTIVEPSLVLLSLFYIPGLALVVSFSWRDFVIPLVGIVIVFVVLLAIAFLLEQVFDFSVIVPQFSLPQLNASFTFVQLLLTSLTLFQFLFLFRLFGAIETKNIKDRLHYWLWVWMAVLIFVSLLFFQSDFNKLLLIVSLGLPSSIFATQWFVPNSKGKLLLKEIAFVTLVLIVFLIRLMY